MNLLKSLEVLDISYNRIDCVAIQKNVPKLKELNISHNPLQTLDGFEFFMALEKLNLKNIEIDDEEDYGVLKKLGNLKELDVDENNMFIEDFIKEKLTWIKYLNGKFIKRKKRST